MTALGARRVGTEVDERLAGLRMAVEAARDRVPAKPLAQAEGVIERAQARLRLSADHTVAALAGATGSGKSSLFNALSGLELAAVGSRRPTTSWPLACAWGDSADDLLEWLGVPARHRSRRQSLLDSAEPDDDLDGLVLLDLPDHDSTEVSHRLEVDRLVARADLMIWILDPQKYADGVLHERYLRPMAAHRDVLVVAFNHVDELSPDGAAAAQGDVRRLLVADGLAGVPVFATSATRGDGLAELRAELVRRVAAKRSARDRLTADIETAARGLDAATAPAGGAAAVAPADLDEVTTQLVDACADAAGVPIVTDAVRDAVSTRGRRATGWPPTAWLSRLRPDPLRQLHLGLDAGTGSSGSDGKTIAVTRTSVPQPTAVQRARVSTAVRAAVDRACGELPGSWATAVRAAARQHAADLPDRLDTEVAAAAGPTVRTPRWWSLARVVQWTLLLIALVGLVWLVLLGLVPALGGTTSSYPGSGGVPIPIVLFIGGLVLGGLLALGCQGLVARSAARAADAVERRLSAGVASAVEDLVAGPMRTELAAYAECRRGIALALGH